MTNPVFSVTPNETGGCDIAFDNLLITGTIKCNREGEITNYSLDVKYNSAVQEDWKPTIADRIGKGVAEHLPSIHDAYVRLGTSFAAVLGDQEKIAAAIIKCESAGENGGRCEMLKYKGDAAWCGACGCPKALKQGCPQDRWV